MTRWPWLLGVGLIAFVIAAVATAPARLAFDLAARPSGVEAGLVTGTIWDASLRRISAGGARIEAARAEMRPAALLGGRAVWDVTISDPDLRGAGRLILAPSGVVIENADGVLRLDQIPALAAASLPAGETARMVIDRLALDDQGGCIDAQGRITTAALVSAGERFGAGLPLLNADLTCLGGALGMTLSAENETLILTGTARLVSGKPDWRLEARTTDREVIAALGLLGFEQQGEVYVADTLSAQEG
ncbi:MAG: type II secretion system protein N [Oceanicaulis sp.]